MPSLRLVLLLFSFSLTTGFLTAPFLSADDSAEFSHGNWPFSPPIRPVLPVVTDDGWSIEPTDRFILDKLITSGLRPSQPAGKLTLLRRLTFDLTGLPPTADEQAEFVADDSPEAYERVIDRLLASPRFGERWAQHWLDVVRYAETEGFKADVLRPEAYRYRDYVIRSFNADRPYDEFVRQQLAGDELDPENPDAIIATGLNRLYPDENNAANLFQRRQEILDEITEITGLAFMGLTMGCAQCHDHKFDDILQSDYYQLQAFFSPMVPCNDRLIGTAEEKAEYRRRQREWEVATQDIREEMESLLTEERKKSREYKLTKFRPEILECVSTPAAERTPLQEQIARMALLQADDGFDVAAAVKKLSDEHRGRYDDLAKRLAEFEHLKPPPLPAAMAVADVGQTPPPTHLLAGGNWRNPRREVEPGFPEFLSTSFGSAVHQRQEVESTGRRSALAKWLTQSDHPLSGRVIVNRLWQHHFGQGIVPTPNDFGMQGEPPTHPELLDWLATELVNGDWSLKRMHRLMVTSAAYRQSSRVELEGAAHKPAMESDPANDLLWRMRPRRLEGEAIRDAMLHLAGRLNLEMYGESARPRLPDDIGSRYAWEPDERPGHQNRRSIYVFAKRNMRFPMFDAFDLPDMHHSTGRRSQTTTAPQALLMINSDHTLEFARCWAERIRRDYSVGEIESLVDEAYRDAFTRRPSDVEAAAARDFLFARSNDTQIPSTAAGPSMEAITDFCHALFNSNEFVYID